MRQAKRELTDDPVLLRILELLKEKGRTEKVFNAIDLDGKAIWDIGSNIGNHSLMLRNANSPNYLFYI